MSTTAYPTAPPAYNSAPPSTAGAPLLNSGSSLTNDPDADLPDDFKYSTTVAQCSLSVRNMFVRKVYTILFCQLTLTGIMSTVFMFNQTIREWVQSHPAMMFVSLFGSMGLLFATYIKRHSYPTNIFFLTGFTLLEGYSVATITTFYQTQIVVEALLITMLVFAGLTLFAMQTKYDFTSWMSYLGMALWALMGMGLIAMFFPYSSLGELGFGALSALLFSGYVLVDTQLIMKHYQPEEEIAASISLYLDFINLFLAILRILNSQQDN
ncbi:inhibitor of apoptosis-promoting Bax1-domain-containing protein [Dipodascopsis tothii]|uniref:inhibitor of apoptosis-promoting Bax1-domain-containing protein n=1 Tax=Dipodascopsis tothii TaxID=44089 RepID=UPI0034CEECC0